MKPITKKKLQICYDVAMVVIIAFFMKDLLMGQGMTAISLLFPLYAIFGALFFKKENEDYIFNMPKRIKPLQTAATILAILLGVLVFSILSREPSLFLRVVFYCVLGIEFTLTIVLKVNYYKNYK